MYELDRISSVDMCSLGDPEGIQTPEDRDAQGVSVDNLFL